MMIWVVGSREDFFHLNKINEIKYYQTVNDDIVGYQA